VEFHYNYEEKKIKLGMKELPLSHTHIWIQILQESNTWPLLF